MSDIGFWQQLVDSEKPIMGLSPMDGVTDVAMRYMTARHSAQNNQASIINNQKSGVDVMFTEFVSVDALDHAKEEKSVDRVMRVFLRSRDVVGASGEAEAISRWPYEVAQVFGHTPELFYQAAVIIATLGFDGMDINMGCPAHKVEEQGSGAGLIRTPEVAQEIVRQAKQAMADYAAQKVSIDDLEVSEMIKQWVKAHKPKYPSIPVSQYPSEVQENRDTGTSGNTILPVSVKTRIGVKEIVVEEWMRTLMEVQPAMISLHGRTLRQLYQGSADWEAIGRAATVVHELGGHILGNGDVMSREDGIAKVNQFGVDGFLIGRAAEGNPGVFKTQISNSKFSNEEQWKQQQLSWMIEHAKIYEKVFRYSSNPVTQYSSELPGNRDTGIVENNNQWFMPMRKHLAWYCKGFPGAGELRTKLVMANSVEEVEEIIGK